jgi:fibro-slime domain-containing protein
MNRTRTNTQGRILAGMLAAAAGCAITGGATAQSSGGNDPYGNLPAKVTLQGVIRDFKERTVPNGHPDFELNPGAGFAQYVGLVQDTLDADGKPVFNSTGYKLISDWRDSTGRNIISPRPYIAPKPGDTNGSKSSTTGNAITNSARLGQWYRDVAGVNVSKLLPITFNRMPNTKMYSFNDKTDPLYVSKGGFFPINGDLFGNSGGSTPNQNFHFTYELNTEFVFEKGTGQIFTFIGDDDVWVFVDNKLVIDIGGIHSAKTQTIEIDRLNWLEDKKTYTLRFFFAERHRTQSNFRIDTTIFLKNVEPPAVTALFD